MYEGQPYIECDEGESKNCADSVPPNLWTWGDHQCFGGKSMQCKKFISAP